MPMVMAVAWMWKFIYVFNKAQEDKNHQLHAFTRWHHMLSYLTCDELKISHTLTYFCQKSSIFPR